MCNIRNIFGFKHLIFIAVVAFLSLWTWMLRYEVMRFEGSGRFLLDRFTGKTYVAGGSSPWHETKFPVVSKLPPIDRAYDELLAEEERKIDKLADELLAEEAREKLTPKSADSTDKRTKP